MQFQTTLPEAPLQGITEFASLLLRMTVLPPSTVGVQSLTYLHARVWAAIRAPQYCRRQGPTHSEETTLSQSHVFVGVKPIPSWNSPRLLMAYAAFFFDDVVSIFSSRFNASRSLGRCR